MASDVTFSGPLFDGRAEASIKRGIVAVRHAVAADGERMTRAFFMGSIREDRGRFMATIETIDGSRVFVSHSGHHTYTMPIVTDRSTETLVTSSLATYGPWLEGTGSRNQSTRFRGYHGFRRASEALDRVAGHVGQVAIDPYVRECN